MKPLEIYFLGRGEVKGFEFTQIANLIELKAGETEIWIDMETHVRSDFDRQFDLEKVEKCLEISSQYIK